MHAGGCKELFAMTNYKLETHIDPAFNPSLLQQLSDAQRTRDAANQNNFDARPNVPAASQITCADATALCMLDSAIGG
jgi:hypothetical protein